MSLKDIAGIGVKGFLKYQLPLEATKLAAKYAKTKVTQHIVLKERTLSWNAVNDYLVSKSSNLTYKQDILVLNDFWHFFKEDNCLLLARQVNEEDYRDIQVGERPSSSDAYLDLYFLSNDKTTPITFLEKCIERYNNRENSGVEVYRLKSGHYNFTLENKLSFKDEKNVHITPEIQNELIDDCMDFINSKEWYLSRQIPYQRGYLLHGPPGTGKTTLCYLLASILKYKIYTIATLNERALDALQEMPDRSILVLEDFDAMVPFFKDDETEDDWSEQKRRRFGTRPTNGITYSQLLNALDGLNPTHGRVIMATTNHIEELPEAILRPGRLDKKIYVGYATPEQLRDLHLRFFDNKALIPSFVKAIGDKQYTMAEMQEILLVHKDNPKDIPSYIKNNYSELPKV